jgi:hypothetical protein
MIGVLCFFECSSCLTRVGCVLLSCRTGRTSRGRRLSMIGFGLCLVLGLLIRLESSLHDLEDLPLIYFSLWPDRGLDFWRRPDSAPASRPLRFTPINSQCYFRDAYSQNHPKCPSVSLAQKTPRRRGERGFPYEHWHVVLLFGVHRGQIPARNSPPKAMFLRFDDPKRARFHPNRIDRRPQPTLLTFIRYESPRKQQLPLRTPHDLPAQRPYYRDFRCALQRIGCAIHIPSPLPLRTSMKQSAQRLN